MKNMVVLFFIGLALLALHFIAPQLVPYGLDLLTGIALVALAVIVILQWIIKENHAKPAIVRLEPNEEDLRNATPEILYLLEDGWGVKKIVDMISANYQMPPKMVYEHVMELMSSRQESIEFAQPDSGPSGNPLHMGRTSEGRAKAIDVNFDELDEE